MVMRMVRAGINTENNWLHEAYLVVKFATRVGRKSSTVSRRFSSEMQ